MSDFMKEYQNSSDTDLNNPAQVVDIEMTDIAEQIKNISDDIWKKK